MRVINVLIADDSGFMQLLIKSILMADKQINVVGTAGNGKEAFELTKKKNPDVVLMDLLMPEYDGRYGIRKIMDQHPTPVIILSKVGNTNLDTIMSCLDLGAVDYINKPEGGNTKLRKVDTSLLRMVKNAAAVDCKKLLKSRIESNRQPHTFNGKRVFDIIVIGASTGGPNALERIIKKFPVNLNIPVLIVQHMPVHFIQSLAVRFDKMVDQKVLVAKEGMEIKGGSIYIAPGKKNISLYRDQLTGSIRFTRSRKSYKAYNNPSINSVMEGVAKIYGNRSVGVILTGMGTDGADGLEAIYRAGGYTVAQDKESSVVYGMPKEAANKKVVKRIVPIDEMGEFLISCIS